jgi:type IX secretion system PorP/SprF family membrane protein
MKKYLILFTFLLGASVAEAQQKALSSQYMTNYFLLNPAVAGYEKDLNFKAGFRNQWVGFEGAPQTFYLSGEGALFQNSRRRRRGRMQGFHGVGGYLYTDNTGPTRQTAVLASYAYHVPLNRELWLSSGMFVGAQQFKFDPNKVQLADNSNHLDPVTASGPINKFMPDLTLGVNLHSEQFFVGVSLFQVLGNKFFEVENGTSDSRLYRHLFVSGGYNFDVKKNISLSPSILFKYAEPAPVQADFNLKGIYHFSKRRRSKNDDQIWAAVSYRTQDAVVALLGTQFKEQYQFSYSYDITVSKLRPYSAGSHEIMLGFRVKQ